MEHLYIDESGSMTSNYTEKNPYFVISIVRVLDVKSLKKSIKRFVRKFWDELKACDRTGRMFRGDKFLELKGSALTSELKRAFVDYLVQDKSFEVFYVILDNKKIEEHFYNNTARAFNYVVKLSLAHFIRGKYIKKHEDILIQIDERNERPEAKLHLQEYLNTAFQLEEKLTNEITVEYFDSCNNSIIQLADFFANLMYTQLHTQKYNKEMKLLRDADILKKEFKFPI